MPNGHKNLTLSRAPVNVWEQPGWGASLSTVDRERVICGAWGALLTIYGLRRRGWLGHSLVAAGTGIVARAAAGHHDLTRARTWIARALDVCGWGRRETTDAVIDASDASFPASDAPSWTPTAGVKAQNERARTKTKSAKRGRARAREGQQWQ